MSADQRELYDRLVGGPRASGPRPFPLVDEQGRLAGPFNAMLLNPELGDALQALGAIIRYKTAFTQRQREIAILATAAYEDSPYEWAVHSHVAAGLGLTPRELEALRDGTDVFTDPQEAVVHTAAREVAATGDLGEETYRTAIDALGRTAVYELVTLVGYYRLLAGQMRVFQVTAD
ncbi:MAG: carboxymuconolactone decarboxylase family protein [Streptosporangiales bacterium]|nr:carboxymuconolactone decarboxylase family protein [Streptosporangiales bacterium]